MLRRRKQCTVTEQDINLNQVKDAVITQLQPMHFWKGEIIDIDFGEVTAKGMMKLKIYTKGEKSKTKKD